ncbi:porin [Cognatiyoonia sp. IB215182]|uniref:porin n=1 Tax=Cognatiyoonia sp. IB215182 TaxID=3097353 RepID=UPI002A127EBD|nr:porin [Cognatiyoonia sp. IB215182]MDX8355045.1 porin [Cognatiyoonia sp. IB215182]
MKKVLLATTALVFASSYAAAEVTVSGSANAGLKFSDADEAVNSESTELFYELDFGIAGSTTTDGGIEVGASLDFDLDTGNQSDFIDDPEVFISAGGVTVTVGAVGSADGVVIGGLEDPGFDGIGIDDQATTFWDDGTANVQIKAELGAVTLAASGNLAENDTEADDDYAVGASYDAGAFSVGAAYYELNEDEVFALGAEVTAGGADIALFYHQNQDFVDPGDGDEGVAGFGASVVYPFGDVSVIGTVGATDLEDDEVDFGVGFEYDLGGGVALAGGVGQSDEDTPGDSYAVADFGITMDF